jgi:hypothetical protein
MVHYFVLGDKERDGDDPLRAIDKAAGWERSLVQIRTKCRGDSGPIPILALRVRLSTRRCPRPAMAKDSPARLQELNWFTSGVECENGSWNRRCGFRHFLHGHVHLAGRRETSDELRWIA